MTRTEPSVFETRLPGLSRRGKVRDLYDLGDRLMIVATDRISAFDVVMAQPIPGKGRVLTRLSQFWLERLACAAPHHLDYVATAQRLPRGYESHADQLAGRAMIVRKTRVLPVECVVRGYIVGGGWREYQQLGSISGVKLPAGLRLADKLPEPIFTPSTKAEQGHDEPISFERACELAGPEWMRAARERSIALYRAASEFAAQRGVILADTKFEFGLLGDELILIDETLTPDSSRFWPGDQWRPGENPPSFDKQFLRDYLDTLAWGKTPPPPELPEDIIQRTAERYREAERRLTS